MLIFENPMRRIVDFLRSSDLPYLSRSAFRQERAYYLIWALVLGSIEGNLAGIVVSKTFTASKLLTIIVCALPVVMMTLNLFWGIIVRGRDRKRLLILLTLGTAICVCSIGLNPSAWRPWSGWLFALQIALTHFFVSGVVTVRASIWRLNYPDHFRGKIIGRLQNIHFLFVPSSAALITLMFNLHPEYYRWVYPAAALIGLLSLWPLARFRVRRQKVEAACGSARSGDGGGGAPSRRSGFWAGVKEAGAILREDRTYRRYMIAQFLLGSANFYTDPVLLTVVTTRMKLDYVSAGLIMIVIPGMLAWFAIPYWADHFDKFGVLRFRVSNAYMWLASYVGVLGAMVLYEFQPGRLWPAVSILVIARALMGLAHGGGIIAWNLGHMQFARPNQVDLYMSIHVGLTGLRALTMPYLNLIANALMGAWSFGVAIAICGASLRLFRRLEREDAAVFSDQPRRSSE